MEPTVVVDQGNVVGENPLWDAREERLYWCEHEGPELGRIFSYDPEEDSSRLEHETEYIGGFTLQDDGSLLLFMRGGRVASWDGTDEETVIADALPDEAPEVLFNDVIADPEGRVFAGTRYSDDRTGALYRLDTDRSMTTVIDDVGLSNGMGFTPDLSGLYFTDSEARRISRYEYDRSDGRLSDERTYVSVASDDGLPDGMTVDADGYVWSAHAFGSAVVRYTPDGTEDRRVEFPVGLVTSVTFGGDDLGTLYVTSGGGQDKAKYGSDAGALFQVRPETPGREEHRSRVRL